MPMRGPRKPNAKERRQLLDWLADQRKEPSILENEEEEIAGCAIAVFDGYITDGPGYCGKIMTVVWSGAPSIFNVFTFNTDTGKLEDEIHELCTCRS